MSSAPAQARSASAFSTSTLHELAQRGPIDFASSRLRHLVEPRHRPSSSTTLAQVFEDAFLQLSMSYRSEYVYKNTLVSKIVFGKHSPRTAAAMLEVPMGHSCADVVILNGTITTYEIKTDLDNLKRLAAQLSDYCSRSEHVNVVTSDARAHTVERSLPAGVGLIALRRNGALSIIKPSESNRSRLNADHLFLLLRTDEARRVAFRMTGTHIMDPAGRAWPQLRALLRKTDPFDMHNHVLSELRVRQARAAILAGNELLPVSLRALAYATDLSAIQTARLLARLAHEPAGILAELS